MSTALKLDSKTMRAVVQDRYGADPAAVLRLERIPAPAIGDDEVLVRVRAAGVDRGTWHLMTGYPRLMRYLGFGRRGPRTPVPGLDVAGTVDAVGRDVTDVAPGDEVFGAAKGSFAEYAVAKADRLAPKPANLTFEQAAPIAVSGVVALQAMRDKARVQPGDRVLILGASGGVGSYAVQIAKALGAEVTGVSGAANLDLLSALGADHAVAYTREDPVDGRHRYDAIVDIAGNRPLAQLRRALTPDGRLVLTGGENGGPFLGGIGRNLRAHLLSPFVGQRLLAFVSRIRRDDLLTLRDMIESGAVTPAIDRVYPLDETAAALRHLADGHPRGKIAIRV